MKTIMIIAGVMLTCFTMYAQENAKQDTYPYWTISKDVQKIQFRHTRYVPSIAMTGTNSMVVSKGIQAMKQPVSTITGRVQKTGTPSWLVSKGVAQRSMDKR